MRKLNLLAVLLSLLTAALHPQLAAARSKNGVDSLLQSGHFTFHADRIQPESGPQQVLTAGYYDVTVTRDSVVSFLPYIGRAYIAPANPSEGGIKFTSRKFRYEVTARKRGGYEVTITPEDVRDVQRLYFLVSPDGTAGLQVTRVYARQVGFTGAISRE